MTPTHRVFPVGGHGRERRGLLADPVGVVPHAGAIARWVVEPLPLPEPVASLGHLRVGSAQVPDVHHLAVAVVLRLGRPLRRCAYRLFPVLLHLREGRGPLSDPVHAPHAVLPRVVLLRLRVVLVPLLSRAHVRGKSNDARTGAPPGGFGPPRSRKTRPATHLGRRASHRARRDARGGHRGALRTRNPSGARARVRSETAGVQS